MPKSDASLAVAKFVETYSDKSLAAGHFPETLASPPNGWSSEAQTPENFQKQHNAIIALSNLLEVEGNVGCSKKLRTPLLRL